MAGAGAHDLLRALKYHRVMTIDLSFNSLGAPEAGGMERGPVAKGLKQLIRQNRHVTHLDLSWNNFRADACAKLSDWFKANHSIFGLHVMGNAGTVLDARGFLRQRHVLPPTAAVPAHPIDYPHNRCLPAHDRCWICGRWAETTVTLTLDIDALPAPSFKDGATSLGRRPMSRGAAGKKKMGSVGSRGSTGGSSSQGSSASSDMSTGGGGGAYEELVATCHLSFDDPAFSSTIMEEHFGASTIMEEHAYEPQITCKW